MIRSDDRRGVVSKDRQKSIRDAQRHHLLSKV